MSDDVDFDPVVEEPPKSPSKRAIDEERSLGAPIMKPNTIVLPMWRKGHVSFEPESGVQIFAILALVMVLLTMALLGLIGIFVDGAATWLDKAFTALGNVISAVVGAMVGSSVSKTRRR